MTGTYAAFRVDPTLNFDNFEQDAVESPTVANFSRPISIHPRASRSTFSLANSSRPSSVASSRGPATPSHDALTSDFLAGPFIIPGNQAPQYTVEDMNFMRNSVKFPELHLPVRQSFRPVSRASTAPSIASTTSSLTSQKRPCPIHGHRPASSHRASHLPSPPSINPHRTSPPSPLRESIKPVATDLQADTSFEKPRSRPPCPIHGSRPISSRKSTFTSSPLTIDVELASTKRSSTIRASAVSVPARPSTQDTVIASPIPDKAFVIPGNLLPQAQSQIQTPQTQNSPRVNVRFSFEEDVPATVPLLLPSSSKMSSLASTPKTSSQKIKQPCPVHGLPRPPFTNRKSSLTPSASPVINPVDEKTSQLAESAVITALDISKPLPILDAQQSSIVPTSFNQYKEALAQRQEEAKRSGVVHTDAELPFLKQDPFQMGKENSQQRPKSAGAISGMNRNATIDVEPTNGNKSYAASVRSSKSTRSIRGGLSKLRRAFTRKKSFVDPT